MERALGKQVMDAEFRDAVFRDPLAAGGVAGIELAEHERSALLRIRPGALAAFQRYLDSKQIGEWVHEVSA